MSGEAVWTFLNSNIGLMLIGMIFTAVGGFLWKKVPAWQSVYDANKGIFFDAVRWAEKKIPDDTENVSAKRADEAFKFLLKFAPEVVAAHTTDTINKAVSEAHDDMKAGDAPAALVQAAVVQLPPEKP